MPRKTLPGPQPPPSAHLALARLVRASGRTLRDIGAAAEFSHTTLSAIMHGRRGITAESLRRLLTALGKSWADLDDG